jgi:serine/threonine protein kinase
MGDSYDESVDIWALGITLYEMFYKTNPFKVTNKDQLINIVNDPIDFPSKVKLSQAPRNFIEMCLAKRAVERPNIR